MVRDLRGFQDLGVLQHQREKYNEKPREASPPRAAPAAPVSDSRRIARHVPLLLLLGAISSVVVRCELVVVVLASAGDEGDSSWRIVGAALGFLGARGERIGFCSDLPAGGSRWVWVLGWLGVRFLGSWLLWGR